MPMLPPALHGQLVNLTLDSADLADVLTPALAIYPDVIRHNIAATVGALNGDVSRWQPHVKTAKLAGVLSQLCSCGVKAFKCATTLEMLTACRAGAKEVLMAYPSNGSRAARVKEIATAFPNVRISATVESAGQVAQWRGHGISLYIDINPEMNRTGISQYRTEEISEIAARIVREDIHFAGLHYYDGQNRQPALEERMAAAFSGYEQLLRVADSIAGKGIPVEVIITSGTPATPCALAFPGFINGQFTHRISPGTVIYNDLNSLSQIPSEWGYRLGAIVITSVVSHPAPGLITCDAGHKAVSSDSGLPNCLVLGHPELEPQRPSEEHLPIRVPEGVRMPKIGEHLYLVPRHVCTTVNNFDTAIIVEHGAPLRSEDVTARGREDPLTLVRESDVQAL